MATLCQPEISVRTPEPISLKESTLGELRILSLAMLIHNCREVFLACSELSDAADWLSRLDPPTRLLEKGDTTFVLDAIRRAIGVVASLGIEDGGFTTYVKGVSDHVESLYGGIWQGIFEVRANVLASDYRRIRESLREELARYKFVHIPSSGAVFFHQERLFGDAVYDSFPTARYDIAEAGNALAFEMYTAAVFHLMRAAEIGLRALARDRRIVYLPKKNNAHISMGTWEDILRELDREAAQIANWPNVLGEVKAQAQAFYNSSILEYRGFKDAFRNHVMHTRWPILREEALSNKEHVQRLMQILAGRISETKCTPLIWTKGQLR
jgi:hypothetical protein